MLSVIKADWLIDGTGALPVRTGAVAYAEDKIVKVGPFSDMDLPSGASVLELPGQTVLPGLINSHSHCSIIPGLGNQPGQMREPAAHQLLRAVGNMRRELLSGVTTFRVMGEEFDLDFDLKRAIDAGLTPGPRLLPSGVQITASNGHGRGLTSTDGADAVRARARQNLAKGAQVVKIFVTGGVSSTDTTLGFYSYTAPEISAACEEAHRVGKKVAAHAHGGPGLCLCLDCGVDSIEHGALVTEGDIEKMIEKGAWLVGTFSILFHPTGIEQTDARVPSIWSKVLEARNTVEATYSRVLKSGVKYSVGTDSMHGLLGYEMELLTRFGATPMEAIVACTSRAADLCDVKDNTGSLVEGKKADIISVQGNPLEDIQAMQKVRVIVKDGQRFDQLSLF